MTDKSAPSERLSKFSNADRGAYTARTEPAPPDAASRASPLAQDLPLSDLLEHLIRDNNPLNAEADTAPLAPVRPAASASSSRKSQYDTRTSERLLEELRAAQELPWIVNSDGEPVIAGLPDPDVPPPEKAAGVAGSAEKEKKRRARAAYLAMQRWSRRVQPAKKAASAARWTGVFTLRGARAGWRALRSGARQLRPSAVRRRHLKAVTALHRHLFDRRIERLLFVKTPQPDAASSEIAEAPFVFRGPVPRLALSWALSGLPGDLKRYVFVDFRALHGRTLLLAAQRNFEYAIGYAFDAPSCEELEMNFAQYPRSLMKCRDVRAIRGDIEGVIIPAQPCVLYFPDGMSESHIDIITGHAEASFFNDPRPIYFVFENSSAAYTFKQTETFDRVPLPFLPRSKLWAFSPVRIAVYKSKYTEPKPAPQLSPEGEDASDG